MHCFVHDGTEAIGVCKHCFKAVCRNCVRELPFGIACSENCEQGVNENNHLTERALRMYGLGRNRPKIPEGAIWQFIMGFGFGAFGLLMVLKNKWTLVDASYFFFFSALFFVVGLRAIFRKTGVRC